MPFCVIADEAFPLLTNLMRPFPGRSKGNLPEDQIIFNYRYNLKWPVCSMTNINFKCL